VHADAGERVAAAVTAEDEDLVAGQSEGDGRPVRDGGPSRIVLDALPIEPLAAFPLRLAVVWLVFRHSVEVSTRRDLQAGGDPMADGEAGEQAAIDKLKALFMGLQARRYVDPDRRVQRPVFLKPQGSAKGVFRIEQGLPQDLRVGVFAHRDFPVWVRFSANSLPQLSDAQNNTLGLGLKLLGVPGAKILEGEQGALTHDFVLQNHDVFFVDNAQGFAEVTEASFAGKIQEYLAQHPVTAHILGEMAKAEDSVLLARYSSTVPYAFGDRHVKYAVRASEGRARRAPVPEGERGEDYLRRDLRQRLMDEGASFDFFIQLQTDPIAMPLERATVRWSEALSPLVKVATVDLPPGQDIEAIGESEDIDNLSYTPWHALREHEPVGSINRARRVVYKALADDRRRRNHVPVGEPFEGV
jgi:hypothetical protein